MNKASEKMDQRQVVMEDGRYLIFFTFAPHDPPGSSRAAAPTPKVKPIEGAKEN